MIMNDYENYHFWHITEKLNMDANYYDIYTSLSCMYDKLYFQMAKFLETQTMALCEIM